MILQDLPNFDDQNNLLICSKLNGSNNELINTKIGIYGWRKRCLYFLILIIIIVLFVNISITVWILVSISFNYNGLIGNLKFTSNGLELNGQSIILNDLVASKISLSSNNNKKIAEDNLNIFTDNSIRFYTKNKINNKLENTFSMNNKELILNCNNFTILNKNNQTLFTISEKYAQFNTEDVKFKNHESMSLKFESLETNNVHSKDNLNILTNNGSVKIESTNLTLNGTILTFNSKNNLTINASKRITFQAEEIKIIRLPEFEPTSSINEKAVNSVMQLCLCKNGLLYAQNPKEACTNDVTICEGE